MEFSTNFVVINTAFDLATKLHCGAGGLQHYEKHVNAKCLTICCRALSEAVNNTWKSHKDEDKESLKLNIVAALVAKLQDSDLQKEGQKEDWTVDNDSDYFYAVTVGLPAFNRTFLFDLVKNCDMSKQFCQVIYNLQPEITTSILLELLQHVQIETDSSDLIFLTEILEHLILEPNSYMVKAHSQPRNAIKASTKTNLEVIERLRKYIKPLKAEETNFTAVITELVNCLQKFTYVLEEQEDRLKLRTFLTVIGLTNCIISGKVVTKSDSETWKVCMQRYGNFFRHTKCNSQAEFEVAYFYLESLQLDDTWSTETFCHILSIHEVTSLIQWCENWRRMFLPNFVHGIFEHWKEQLADVALLSTSDGVVFRKDAENQNVVLPDVNQTLMLLGNVDSVLPQYNCPEINAYSNGMQELKTNLERLLENAYQQSLQRLRVRTAAAIVELKFPKYQDYLLKLCRQPIKEVSSHLDDWAGFLKRNIAFITKCELQALLQQTETLLHEPDKQEDLNKVILAAYRKLSTPEKLEILENIVQHHDPEVLFMVKKNREFVSKLTSVFNKLANITDTEKAVGEVCILALQSPRKTLNKMLSDAIDSPGQQPLLVKLLQSIPVLCFHTDDTGQSVVGAVLNILLLDVIDDKKKLANFNRLLVRLFKGHAMLHGRSVLLPEDFLQTTILPHFSAETQNSNIPLEVLLQLLLTSLQCRDDIRWMAENRIFPIILCLCRIVDEHRILDCNDVERSLRIKSLAISCLSHVEKSFIRHSDARTEKLLKWLYNSMQVLHWTTVLLLQKIIEIFPECSLALPSSLEGFLQKSTKSWTFNIQNVDVLNAVLEFGMVSKDTLKVAMEEGDVTVFDGNIKLSQLIVAALAKKLQHSTGAEWSRASALIQHLIRSNVVSVSVRPAARDSFPCVNLTDMKVLVGTSQLLWEVMILMSRNSEHSDLNRSVLACEEYVGVFKTLLGCSDIESNKIEQLFVLSQLFCQHCFMLSEFVSECRDILMILVLDILNNHGKLCASVVKHRNNDILMEITNQKTAMERAIRQAPNSQQRTLLKKFTI